MVEDVLKSKSGGEEILEEYQRSATIRDVLRRKMVNILVAHMIDTHGYVCLFPLFLFAHIPARILV